MSDVLKPPAYLLRNIEKQGEALQIVRMQHQAALNLAGEWLAETLGVSVEEAVVGYDFDGRSFTKRAVSAASEAAPSQAD